MRRRYRNCPNINSRFVIPELGLFTSQLHITPVVPINIMHVFTMHMVISHIYTYTYIYIYVYTMHILIEHVYVYVYVYTSEHVYAYVFVCTSPRRSGAVSGGKLWVLDHQLANVFLIMHCYY